MQHIFLVDYGVKCDLDIFFLLFFRLVSSYFTFLQFFLSTQHTNLLNLRLLYIDTAYLSFPMILINFLLPFHHHCLSLSTFPHPSNGDIFTPRWKLFIILMCPRVSKVPTILHCCCDMLCVSLIDETSLSPLQGLVALLLKCGPLRRFPTLVLRRL